jgi:hypothetical protein
MHQAVDNAPQGLEGNRHTQYTGDARSGLLTGARTRSRKPSGNDGIIAAGA